MNSSSIGYLAICFAAVVSHELAHVLVATTAGIRIKRMGVTWKGPYIVREQGPPLANFFTALAGPAMNLALCVGFWKLSPQFGVVNLVLGAYNLVPFIPGLDGYNALHAYRRLSVPANARF